MSDEQHSVHDDPLDVDPTGMRSLLRALPDPGPMPEELIQRIEARLAVEQSHRTREQASPPAGALSRGDTIVDLAAERSHRRPGRTLAILGAAAAGLMLTTVAINQLVGPGAAPTADSAAFAPASGRAGQDSGAGSDVTADEEKEPLAGHGEDGAARSEPEAAADGGTQTPIRPVILVPDLGDLPDLGKDPNGFALLIARAAQQDLEPSLVSTSSLTVAQANSCWDSTADAGPWDTYFAATGRTEDASVVVLLGMDADGAGHAWVVPARCSADSTVAPLADAVITP